MTKTTKLNQIVATETGIKAQVQSEVTQLHRKASAADNFNGFHKEYQRSNEEGEEFPTERKKVQLFYGEVIKEFADWKSKHFNAEYNKDAGNCEAKADIVVDGQVILANVPVTFLLFLEKEPLLDLRKFVASIPVLDEAEDWQKDPNSSLYKTNSIRTAKTKNIQKPVVLYDATPEHPAQVQLANDNVLIGYWNNVRHSGAMPLPEKKALLTRIEKLLDAVKRAREEANCHPVVEKDVASSLFNYLLP